MKGDIPLREIFSHPHYEMPSAREAGEPVTVRSSHSSDDLGNFVSKEGHIRDNAPQFATAYKVVNEFVVGDERIMSVQYYK